MRVDVEEYTICQDGSGKVWVERRGAPWIADPPGAKLWVAVAYELVCLRRIAAEAVALADAARNGEEQDRRKLAYMVQLMGPMNDLLAQLEGVADFRRNLGEGRCGEV